jgi:hypothetical protein
MQLGFGALAVLGSRRPELPVAGAAWYYTVMTGASVAGLARVLSGGPDVTWAPAREKA